MPSTEIADSPRRQAAVHPHRVERSRRRLDLDPCDTCDVRSSTSTATSIGSADKGSSQTEERAGGGGRDLAIGGQRGRGDRHPFRLRRAADPVHLGADAAQQAVGHATFDHAIGDVVHPDLVAGHEAVLVACEIEHPCQCTCMTVPGIVNRCGEGDGDVTAGV